MKDIFDKQAIVAISRLTEYGGSEISSFEIAQALRNLGYQVKLVALEIGEPFIGELELAQFDYLDVSKQPDLIRDQQVELLWVSHHVIAYSLLLKFNLNAKISVYSSLSYFEPLEAPPLSGLGFSKYLANSIENYNYVCQNYPALAEKFTVFPNSCPKEYFDIYESRKTVISQRNLSSLLVVSNHVVPEVAEMITLLRDRGYVVDLIGVQGVVKKITANILAKYSAVFSIGKTVQYALACGTPIFCYDHYGGPGWINLDNFSSASEKNFSGRCTPFRLSAHQLVDRIINGFEIALLNVERLNELAKNEFDLEANLRLLLGGLNFHGVDRNFSETDRNILIRSNENFLVSRNIINNYKSIVAERDRCVLLLNENNVKLTQKLEELNKRDLDKERTIEQLDQEKKLLEAEVQTCRSALQEMEERDFKVRSLELDLVNLRNSISWKITAPLRRYAGLMLSAVGKVRTVVTRARFIYKEKGLVALSVVVFKYCVLEARSLYTALKLSRLKIKSFNRLNVSNRVVVSFVVPIYDRTDVLRVAIKSALAQTIQNFEVILVLDGSPPDTRAVVEEFCRDPRVRVFSFPHSSGNAVRGRNKGIFEARGKYIAFLDSDDVASSKRIELCLPLLESGEADVVYGHWRAIIDGTRQIDGLLDGQIVRSPDCDFEMLREICVPCQSTVMVRRECFERVGFLKNKMEYREDHELWTRLAYFGAKFKAIPYVLVDLRLHAGNNELNFKADDEHWKQLMGVEYKLLGPKPKKIVFIMAGLGISGGAAVILKHAEMLVEYGHDVLIVNLGLERSAPWFGKVLAPIVGLDADGQRYLERIDLLIATFWTTAEWLYKIPSARRLYFVQSDERLFYESDRDKALVGQTYQLDCEYLAVAKWIVDMLDQEFGRKAYYVPNGLDLKLFYPGSALEERGRHRPRVLIEGPVSVPFKGVREAYEAVKDLDCDIWFVSSNGVPLEGWRYDRFFESVRHEDMRSIYSSCDILLKMSRVESFAYPPLEAMACGCAVVLAEVSGCVEYARHGENMLVVRKGDVAGARAAVKTLIDDCHLREKIIKSGFETVSEWTWDRSRAAMLELVNGVGEELEFSNRKNN